MNVIEPPEVRIYQLSAILRGISPLIWPRLLVRNAGTKLIVMINYSELRL
jgi:hypothetical protein